MLCQQLLQLKIDAASFTGNQQVHPAWPFSTPPPPLPAKPVAAAYPDGDFKSTVLRFFSNIRKMVHADADKAQAILWVFPKIGVPPNHPL